MVGPRPARPKFPLALALAGLANFHARCGQRAGRRL